MDYGIKFTKDRQLKIFEDVDYAVDVESRKYISLGFLMMITTSTAESESEFNKTKRLRVSRGISRDAALKLKRIHYDCQLKETFNRRDFLLLKPNTINIIECLKESSLDKNGVYLIYLKYRKKEESLRKKRVDDFTPKHNLVVEVDSPKIKRGEEEDIHCG
ncbi:hypothetical protein H8356DRAFT_1325174 [Neocallimastix lanati (nom. inval.)]|nr:hypothetical protein H8356DRAFT_1325174 [Neocallimastix sp. JGI-2020a]